MSTMGLPKLELLVVDDDENLRKMVRISLEGDGWEIYEAGNAAEAMRICHDIAPEFVLLDLGLPGNFDGFSICEALRRMPSMKGAKIVILTGFDELTDVDRAYRAGANAYVVKPFSPLQLPELFARLPAPEGMPVVSAQRAT
jgi:DNA-binding response OmpR family regulator